MRKDLSVEIRTGFALLAARQTLVGDILGKLASSTLSPEEASALGAQAREHHSAWQGLMRILEDEIIALLGCYDESLTHLKATCLQQLEHLHQRMEEIEKARRIGPFKPSPIKPN